MDDQPRCPHCAEKRPSWIDDPSEPPPTGLGLVALCILIACILFVGDPDLHDMLVAWVQHGDPSYARGSDW